MRRGLFALATLAGVSGCVPTPIAPPAPRSATTVAAPFSRTWTAVIDLFGERNIQIRTIDRSSGIIVAEPMKVGTTATDLADCGTMLGVRLPATDATWNVLVRGDSTSSTVRANVRFVRVGTSRGLMNTNEGAEECSTRGVWETDFESQIKQRAEGAK